MKIRIVIERNEKKREAKLLRKLQRLQDAVNDTRAERDRVELFTGAPHYGPPSRLRKLNDRLEALEEELFECEQALGIGEDS